MSSFAVLVGLLGALLASDPTSGAKGAKRAKGPPQLRHVIRSAPSPPGTTISFDVLCPAKAGDVIGGGVSGVSSTGSTDFEVQATRPENLGEDLIRDDGWFGAVSNKDDPGAAIAVSVICAKKAGLRYRVRSGPVSAGLDSQSVESVNCPKGTQVTGGGVDAADGGDFPFEVAGSAPFDEGGAGGDKDRKKDDGWFAVVTNLSAQVEQMDVFAICAGRGAYRYVQAATPVPRDGVASKQVLCPKGSKVVGGGVDTTGLHPDFEIGATGPIDGKDKDFRGDDGWSARMNNDSPDPPDDPGRDTTMTVHAICLA